MNYILFDPPETRKNLLPLTFTRPVSEIRIGILNIREKWEKLMNCDTSWITESYLSDKYPENAGDENIYINGSILPDMELIREIQELSDGRALYSGDTLVAVKLVGKSKDNFDPAGNYEKIQFGKEVQCIEFPWDVFKQNGRAIEADFKLITTGKKSAKLSPTNQVLGTGNIFLEEGSDVECATLNTNAGSIYIGKDAEIMEGSHVRGPFALCEKSTLKLGAKIYGPTTIGPHCKVGGEVNNSVFFEYSNKSHDGFLGNSVIGEWCNIGADSNNSNLKNNYAEVRVWNYGKEKFIPSGLTFCGLIMGDHSKCGINTMFNTGTVVGVNANIYGSGFPRNFIPSFSWGGPLGFTTYQLNKAFEVAEEVMSRRDLKLLTTERNILSEIFRMTEKYRT
jgi:UDP-N-acetylglucosamine diphosphorylase/glucosamine-1-phosphate N-acetyltransferase